MGIEMKELLCDIWEIYDTNPNAICCITTNSTIRNGCAVMGRGVALQAKKRWPSLPETWAMQLYKAGNHVALIGERLLAFPVKREVRYKASMKLIYESLCELSYLRMLHEWTEVFLPRPGCGAGGLDWKDVRPLCKPFHDWLIVVDRPRKEQKK